MHARTAQPLGVGNILIYGVSRIDNSKWHTIAFDLYTSTHTHSRSIHRSFSLCIQKKYYFQLNSSGMTFAHIPLHNIFAASRSILKLRIIPVSQFSRYECVCVCVFVCTLFFGCYAVGYTDNVYNIHLYIYPIVATVSVCVFIVYEVNHCWVRNALWGALNMKKNNNKTNHIIIILLCNVFVRTNTNADNVHAHTDPEAMRYDFHNVVQ